MLPDGTTHVYSYDEARNGAEYPYTVWYGLQMILKRIRPITMDDVEKAAILSKHHLGSESFFNYDGWKYIVEKHNGYLPVEIRAVDEGTKVPVGNAMMTIENTDDKCAFVTNHIESILMQVWYPSNVATQSAYIKDVIKGELEQSSDLPDEVQDEVVMFLCHDFGFRASTGPEAGAVGGSGHLVNFYGTDTIPAMLVAEEYYDANPENIGFSVAASEHSVATAYGIDDQGELNYVNTLLDRFPNGILSLVADSGDVVRFVDVTIRKLKDKIIQRWENGTAPINRVVVRPDSPRFEGDTAYEQVKWIADTLWDIFGGEVNSKGRRVLHPCCGCIYGDGLSVEDIENIYTGMSKDYDVQNIVVGQGGGLLQKHDRDTQRKAIKCSAQKRNGKWIDIYKKPLDETKSSKKGRLALIKEGGIFNTIRLEELGDRENLLKLRFRNGELFNTTTFDEIRQRVSSK